MEELAEYAKKLDYSRARMKGFCGFAIVSDTDGKHYFLMIGLSLTTKQLDKIKDEFAKSAVISPANFERDLNEIFEELYGDMYPKVTECLLKNLRYGIFTQEGRLVDYSPYHVGVDPGVNQSEHESVVVDRKVRSEPSGRPDVQTEQKRTNFPYVPTEGFVTRDNRAGDSLPKLTSGRDESPP
jgi:hypothetical protein